ncbi:MAG: hypothetical protein L0Z62_49890, partial [Gemmataceae bacterium]|nr:hypothetical protein [Gemmataceae bacterium]
VYPPQLPDLFHGSQLVVLGRYDGQGHAAIKLTGSVGKESKEFVYEVNFPERTNDERNFVEDLWARRKVGYLLDQIRVNGQTKELVEEVVTLAKRYGITTPYTSYLVVPDAPVPVARAPRPDGKPDVRFHLRPAPVPPALQVPGAAPGTPPGKVTSFLKEAQKKAQGLGGQFGGGYGGFGGGFGGTGGTGGFNNPYGGFGGYGLGGFRGWYEGEKFKELPTGDKADKSAKGKALAGARDQQKTLDEARRLLLMRNLDGVQSGRLGVDLSVQTSALRGQAQLSQSAVRRAGGRSIMEVGGVWIDEGFDAKMKTVTVKAHSAAYFRILERHPNVRQVFQLGNYLVWVTPSNTALVIDVNDGVEKLTDAAIDALFVPAKK